MSEKELIRLEFDGRVARMILDNPPDNRMGRDFFVDFNRVLDILASKSGIGCLLVYGAKRHFSAGIDVPEIEGFVLDGFKDFPVKNTGHFSDFMNLKFPAIAVINGLCVGAGMELALACDMRLGSPDAILGLPEITYGIITGLNGSIQLERLIGPACAKEILLQGKMMSGEEAYRMRIINSLYDKKELLTKANELAIKIADEKRGEINAFIKSAVTGSARH